MEAPVGAKTVETALVVIPPREAWGPIQALRRQHDRRFSRWMPHVTLAFPFRPRDRFGEVEHALSGAFSGLHHFRVTLARVEAFASDRSVTIYLAPEPAAPFRDLQAALVGLFPDCDDVARYPGGYAPHLTIGQAYSPKAAVTLMADIRALWTPLAMDVYEVALLTRAGDHPFSVARTLRLGTTALSL